MYSILLSKEEEKEKDVLYPMSVTLDVSHFERSLLNAEAPANAIQKKQYDKKVIQKKKESKKNYFVNNKIHYQYKI